MATAIVWFRRDLRLADTPALRHALAAAERVVPVYVSPIREMNKSIAKPTASFRT